MLAPYVIQAVDHNNEPLTLIGATACARFNPFKKVFGLLLDTNDEWKELIFHLEHQ